MAKTKDFARARNYLWQLLRFRQRSEKEIYDRLKNKEYEPKVIDEAVSYFKDLGYINDKEFAKNWIENRLSKPLGLRVIRRELKNKGIHEETITQFLDEKRQAWNERGIVEELAGKYLSKVKEKNELLQEVKPKLYAYLIRRGFSPDIVSEVISRILKNNN